MSDQWPLSPWVAVHRDRLGFGVQAFPLDTKEKPTHHLLAAGCLAEELGYDAFFISDHPAWGPDNWLHLAALAVKTTRIRLGAIVNCIYYRHPVMMARLAADLDNLSQGRVILGLGSAGTPTSSPTWASPTRLCPSGRPRSKRQSG